MKRINSYIVALLVIIFVHIVVLMKSNFFPYPELFVYPYLTNIGLIPYAQILDQHFPGLMFFSVNLASLGFSTPDSFRILQAGIIAGVHFLLFAVALRLTRSEKSALFANILFFAAAPFLEGNVLWIDNFLPILLLPAFYCLLNKNARSIFGAGVFIGLAILLKQVVAPFATIVLVWLYFENRKFIPYYVVGIAVPLLFLALYVFTNDILDDFVFWTYTFNVTTFAEMGRKFASFRQLLAVGVIYIPALLISGWGLVFRKNLLLPAIFLWGSLLFVYARFDYVHLQPSLPFAILLVVYFFGKLPERLASNLFILFLIPLVWVSSRFYLSQTGNEVKFFGEIEYKVAEKVQELTNEGDPIFMFGTLPHMYQMTSTRPSGNVFVFHFPWFMRVAEDRVLEGLRSDSPKVVVRQMSATIDGKSLFDYMQNVYEYVEQNYEKIGEVGDIEIMVPYENKHNLTRI